jgi:hypothetical protein
MASASALALESGHLLAHRRVSTSLVWDDVSPILAQRCAGCHDGTSVPVRRFDQVRPWVAAIREEVLRRRVQSLPGDAGPHAQWTTLTPLESTRLLDWIDGGAPERRPSASPAAAGEYWCPMHPDVRQGIPGSCPHCAMTLVAFTPDFTRAFTWRVRHRPRNQWQVEVLDERGRPVTRMLHTHERPMHLFAVRADLGAFAHLHPALPRAAAPSVQADAAGSGGAFQVEWQASPGRWRLFGEFFPEAAAPQLLVHDVAVDTPAPRARADTPDLAVTMRPTRRDRAGAVHTLAFTVTEPDGQLPRGLRPYLGAPAHVFAAHESLEDALHGHPEMDIPGTDLTRGLLEVDLILARSGRYRIWLQVQHGERVETLPFDYLVP